MTAGAKKHQSRRQDVRDFEGLLADLAFKASLCMWNVLFSVKFTDELDGLVTILCLKNLSQQPFWILI